MAVRIRMKKLGRKHRPFFRICVMDARKPRDGKAIEELGHYDPMVRDKSKRVELNLDRVRHWISVGAQPSENVAVLIKKVEAGNWGVAKEAPPLIAPKQPEPPKAAVEEGAEGDAPAEATEETAEATE
ncbi:MAG: 30S ribosomal protein S16 [Planctomycetaceae bacterium]